MKATEAINPPEPGSLLAEIDSLTTPFNTSELAVSNLHVGVDNLRMFFRYLRKAHELPTLAHHALIRSTVEATPYGLWALADTGLEAVSRTLRLAADDQANAGRLFDSLGVAVWDTREMRDLVRERYESLGGADRADLNRRVHATDTVAEVDVVVGRRAAFTGLQVWRATSGLAHGSQSAMVALLERAPDGTRTSRMGWTVAFVETAIENVEALLARIRDLRTAPSKPKGGRHA